MNISIRRYLPLALVAVAVCGCAKKPILLTTPCPQVPVADFMRDMAAILMSEGFEVKVMNETVGLLQAESAPDHSIWTGATTVNRWSFTFVDGGCVQANASSYSGSQNVFGATTATSMTPYDDNTNKSVTWYWNVRNKLQQMCGYQITFVKQGTPWTCTVPDTGETGDTATAPPSSGKR